MPHLLHDYLPIANALSNYAIMYYSGQNFPDYQDVLHNVSFGTTARCMDHDCVHIFKCPDFITDSLYFAVYYNKVLYYNENGKVTFSASIICTYVYHTWEILWGSNMGEWDSWG